MGFSPRCSSVYTTLGAKSLATSAMTTGAKSFRIYLLTILCLFRLSSGPKNMSVAAVEFLAKSVKLGYLSLRRELSLIETFLAIPTASLMDGEGYSFFYYVSFGAVRASEGTFSGFLLSSNAPTFRVVLATF